MINLRKHICTAGLICVKDELIAFSRLFCCAYMLMTLQHKSWKCFDSSCFSCKSEGQSRIRGFVRNSWNIGAGQLVMVRQCWMLSASKMAGLAVRSMEINITRNTMVRKAVCH